MEKYTVFVYWKIQHIKNVNSFQMIYKFKAIPIKILVMIFILIKKIIQKYIGRDKGTRIT